MGKLTLTAILAATVLTTVLAAPRAPLSPALLKIESGYYAQLQRLYRDYGTSCAYDLGSAEEESFKRRIDQLNSRRVVEYRRFNSYPSDYPYCTYGYGGPN